MANWHTGEYWPYDTAEIWDHQYEFIYSRGIFIQNPGNQQRKLLMSHQRKDKVTPPNLRKHNFLYLIWNIYFVSKAKEGFPRNMGIYTVLYLC